MSTTLTLQQARAAYEFADEAHEALITRNRAVELDAWNASVLPHLATLLDLDPKALELDSTTIDAKPWTQYT